MTARPTRRHPSSPAMHQGSRRCGSRILVNWSRATPALRRSRPISSRFAIAMISGARVSSRQWKHCGGQNPAPAPPTAFRHHPRWAMAERGQIRAGIGRLLGWSAHTEGGDRRVRYRVGAPLFRHRARTPCPPARGREGGKIAVKHAVATSPATRELPRQLAAPRCLVIVPAGTSTAVSGTTLGATAGALWGDCGMPLPLLT